MGVHEARVFDEKLKIIAKTLDELYSNPRFTHYFPILRESFKQISTEIQTEDEEDCDSLRMLSKKWIQFCTHKFWST